jgi:hypothetical protein
VIKVVIVLLAELFQETFVELLGVKIIRIIKDASNVNAAIVTTGSKQ